MSLRRRIWQTLGIIGALLLVGIVVLGVWFGGVISKALSGECPPEVDRVNATCALLESDKGLRFQCLSPTGTREWAACERRDHFYLSWDRAPDTEWQSDPSASGWLSEGVVVADGGPWSCSNGRYQLSLYPSSIPSGEEGRAAIAFGKACARLINAAR